MSTANNLKNIALDILLKESFSYIEEGMYNSYFQLGIENKKVKGIPHHGHTAFFMYQGTVYPDRTVGGTSIKNIKVNAHILHWSLIEKLDEINSRKEKANYTSIQNLFRIILSNSFNNIVLEEFIPTVLMTKLRKELSDSEYNIINFGTETTTPFEPIETTQQNIAMIKDHYKDSINHLRDLLMERFLLQE